MTHAESMLTMIYTTRFRESWVCHYDCIACSFVPRKVNLFAWSQRSAKAVFLYAIFRFELNMQKKIYNINTSCKWQSCFKLTLPLSDYYILSTCAFGVSLMSYNNYAWVVRSDDGLLWLCYSRFSLWLVQISNYCNKHLKGHFELLDFVIDTTE